MKKSFVLLFSLSIIVFWQSCSSSKYADKATEKRQELPPPPPMMEESDADGIPDLFDQEPNSNESYKEITENAFFSAQSSPLSTFSIDVDRASYSNVRRFINEGRKPEKDAVRIEEMINYFQYDYPQPMGEHPFTAFSEVAPCPWNEKHQLLMIGLQGKKLDLRQAPASNLVFLLDVSGSMNEPDKLPLLQSSLKMLTDNLRKEDRVAIVVYAGAAGLVLPSTADKSKIKNAIDGLSAGGSTAGGEGILLAYKIAKENFIPKGNNRVILATDGDFNVGVSSDREMEKLIEEKRESGIFLTCLGFGEGNFKDSKMETLADKGNGNYAYIDNLQEARKFLVNEMGGTMFTIAKDVKMQIEFNPANVQGYRLIGYENRMLNNEDFRDDKKDAGEMGAGHTVTALYEIIPVGVKTDLIPAASSLKYQSNTNNDNKEELAELHLRYKKPDGNTGIEFNKTIPKTSGAFSNASENMRFAAAVAGFGLLLRDSKYKGNASYDMIIGIAERAKTFDPEGDRNECWRLMKTAKGL